MPDVHARLVVVGKRLAQQGLHGLDPAADLVEVVQLVAAVAEHELGLDVDERLRGDLLVRAVLRLVVVVVQLAVRTRAVGGDEGQQRVPRVADVHVVARRRLAGEPDRALEAALAEAGLEVVADVLDAEPGGVDRLEQVGGELLVRRERRAVGSCRLRTPPGRRRDAPPSVSAPGAGGEPPAGGGWRRPRRRRAGRWRSPGAARRSGSNTCRWRGPPPRTAPRR